MPQALTSSLADNIRNRFLADVPRDTRQSIIDFAESDNGVSQSLYPVQKFALKLMNKEPLDDTVPTIQITDHFRSEVLATLTEVEYYDLLLAEGRISMPYEELSQADILTWILSWGRRGTKSTVIAILVSYRLRNLLAMPNPQRYFDIIETDPISIAIVGLGEENATKLFTKVSRMALKCPLISRHALEPATQSKLKLFTESDMKNPRYSSKGERFASVMLSASANSPSLRGDNNIMFLADEYAHFNKSAKSTQKKPLDKQIFEALSPSISGFRHPSLARMQELYEEDNRYPYPDPKIAGRPAGMGVLLSSPAGISGNFYELYQTAMNTGVASYTLASSIPTWEANPHIEVPYLKAEYTKSIISFEQEFGAQFKISGQGAFKNPAYVYLTGDSRLGLMNIGDLHNKYFLGADFALEHDGTGMSVAHFDEKYVEELEYFSETSKRYFKPEFFDDLMKESPKPVVVVDYMEVKYAGEGIWANFATIPMDELMDWVGDTVSRWHVRLGIYDQWAGEIIHQTIQSRGIPNLYKVGFSEYLNSEVHKCLINLVATCGVKTPHNIEFENQLLNLHIDFRAKQMIKAEVPSNVGHDDLFDAVARAAFLAQAFHMKNFAVLNQMLGDENVVKRALGGFVSTGTGSLRINNSILGRERRLASAQSNHRSHRR